MATTAAALVLRGKRRTTLRLQGEEVVLRRPAKEFWIPVAAIAEVRAEGRSIEIELLGGAEPTIYRVEGVSTAGAAAFRRTVGHLLPPSDRDAGPVDGLSLVDVHPLPGRKWLSGWRLATLLVGGLLYAGLAAAVGVIGGGSRALIVLCCSGGLYGCGLFLYGGVEGLVRQRRLRQRGITVMAQFSHYTDKRKVYTYTTVTGENYTYQSTLTSTDPIEVTYDPAHPGDAETVDGLLGTLMLILFLAIPGVGAAVATFFAARAIAVLWGG